MYSNIIENWHGYVDKKKILRLSNCLVFSRINFEDIRFADMAIFHVKRFLITNVSLGLVLRVSPVLIDVTIINNVDLITVLKRI